MKNTIAVLIFLFGSCLHAVESVSTREEIVSRLHQAEYSGVIGIFNQNDEYKKSFGLHAGRRISDSDHFLIGSVTKQFTAAAILFLSESGKIDLNDKVSKYIPDFSSSEVSIHHLLSQTSGLAEITSTESFEVLKKQKNPSLDPVINLIVQMPMAFKPGDHWAYSNSNYLLLSKIVEVVSKESWWSFLKRILIVPAGMTETFYFTDRGNYLVDGHEFDQDYRLIELPEVAYLERGWANGAGGIESTIGDLAKWNSALFSGRILSESSLRLMTSPQGQVNDQTFYGYGLFLGTVVGTDEPYYFHSGGIPGFIAYNAYYPRRGMSTVALANYVSPEPIDFARAFASLSIKGSAEIARYNDNPSTPQNHLSDYGGEFSTSDGTRSMNLTFENGSLYGSLNSEPRHRLVIRDEGQFYDRSLGAEVTFDSNVTGEFTLQSGDQKLIFKRKSAHKN